MNAALRRTLLSIAIFSPLLALLLAAGGDATAGKKVFLTRCKMCHGSDGTGNPAMARMLKVEFKALDSEYVQKKEDKELIETITKGKGKMAAVRGLKEQQIADVIAFVRSLESGK